MSATPDMFPDLVPPAPAKSARSRRARPAKAPPPRHAVPMRKAAPAEPPRRDTHAYLPPAVVPARQEWIDARYWCEQMLAATDPVRKAECQANMVHCVLALDRSRSLQGALH